MSVIIIHRPSAELRTLVQSTIVSKPSVSESCNTELILQWVDSNGMTDAEIKELMKFIRLNCFEPVPA